MVVRALWNGCESVVSAVRALWNGCESVVDKVVGDYGAAL